MESGTAFALNADKLTTGSALIVKSNSDDEVGRRSIVKFEATHENAGNAQVLNLVQKGYLHRWSNQSHKPGSPLAIESLVEESIFVRVSSQLQSSGQN